MFGIDVGRHSAGLLRFGHDVQRESGFAGTLRAIDLDNATARHAANADRRVETQGGGRNCRNIGDLALAQAHNRSFAKSLFNV